MFSRPSSLKDEIQVNADSPTIEQPDAIKIPLFPYQLAEIARVLQLEKTRFVKDSSDDIYAVYKIPKKFISSPVVMNSNACLLSSPFGSGKTLTVLGIIASRNPRCLFNAINLKDRERIEKKTGGGADILVGGGKLLSCSIIVVGSAVFTQWRQAIAEFTNMKCLEISDIHCMRQFKNLYEKDLLGSYDIILVKNGTIVNRFKSTEEETVSIINTLVEIMGNTCCQWLVYDDYDTIRLPSKARTIDALFTIYVSASSNTTNTNRPVSRIYKTMTELIMDNRHHLIADVPYDKKFKQYFSVSSSTDFIKACTSLPLIEAFNCVYDNPDDEFIKLLGIMGTNEANAVMEGLNADAIGTAAALAGIKADPTAGSIFERLLEGEFAKYELDCLVLEVIRQFKSEYNRALNGGRLDMHPEGSHGMRALQRVGKFIVRRAKSWQKHAAEKKNKTVVNIGEEEDQNGSDEEGAQSDPGTREISSGRVISTAGYASKALEDKVDEIEADYEQKKIKDGRAIDNVKDNLKEQECVICCAPPDDICIAKCCTTIVCGGCMREAFRFQRVRAHGNDKVSITGKCPKCLKPTDITKGIIYVSGISVDEIINSTGIEVKEEIVEEQVAVVAPVDDYGTDNPKLKALWDILRSKLPAESKKVKIDIAGLLPGSEDRPVPPGGIRRVLLFASFGETLDKVANYLGKKSIATMYLGGGIDEIANIVKTFKNATRDTVLLINSNQICAGLNLQFCTDIVFFHQLINSAIESQVAGRAQRVGREYNLRMWKLLYTNEA